MRVEKRKPEQEGSPQELQETQVAQEFQESQMDPRVVGQKPMVESTEGEKGQKGVWIRISDKVLISADAYSWVVSIGKKNFFFTNLEQAFTFLFSERVRTSEAKTVSELLSVIQEAKAWIHGILSPMDTWKTAGVQLGPDLQTAVGTVLVALAEPDRRGRGRKKGKLKEEHDGEVDEGRACGTFLPEGGDHEEGLQ